MKHPGPSAEKKTAFLSVRRTHAERLFFLRRKRPWESDGSPVRNAGSFSGNILRSMDGKSRGPAGVWAAHVSSGRGVCLTSCGATESQREYTPLHRPLFCPFCRKYSVCRALFPAHNVGSSGISHGVLNLIFIKESFYIT